MEPENQKQKKVYFVVGKPIIFKFHVSTLGMFPPLALVEPSGHVWGQKPNYYKSING